jgi:glycosyltransferase involved in cell wall biosynthesis
LPELIVSMTSATRNPLTVLNVAFPLAPVGSGSVGGAEQVVAQLDASLTRAGHHSIVVASEDSEVLGTLIPTARWEGDLGPRVSEAVAVSHREAIETCLQTWPINVVHMHGIDFHRYLPVCRCPVLVTLHLPPAWYPPEIFSKGGLTYFNCVSAAQQRDCPACEQMLPYIENGVSLPLFSGHHAKRKFALALGRVCPEKGFHIALDAARRAGFPLLLAGKVYGYSTHQMYFHKEIEPRLDRWRIFIGSVGLPRKRRLLSAATCLVAPSLAAETSSLVAMEALACGTPVVAFPAGALAGIVEHGRTGFLVKNEAEMAEAIQACQELDPENCRDSARRRFDLQRTVSQYFHIYEKLTVSTPPGRTSRAEIMNKTDGDQIANMRGDCRDRSLHTAGAGTTGQ